MGSQRSPAYVTGMILAEHARAVHSNPPFNSAHEGFAVLLEEVHELWDEVRKPEHERDPRQMQREAVQVAAMAVRFILDVCKGCNDGL